MLSSDRRGRALRAVGLVLDITAEKAMEEQMLRMVMSDALTGVPNRRSFDHTVKSEWRRCSRELQPLAVVMVDIDHFKRFNDTFGHLIGDEALTSVARPLTAALLRPADVVARFGGEEFAAVLPGVDAAGGLVVAQRMVEAVRAVTVRQAPDWRLSVSAGVAGWDPTDPATKPTALLARADAALYAAKSGGRDRAETAEPAARPVPVS